MHTPLSGLTTSHYKICNTYTRTRELRSSMASKAFLVFALLVAAAFLVASAEQTQDKKEAAKAGEQDYRGGGYPYPGHGGGGGGYPGHGGGGGGYPGGGHGGGGGGYPGGGHGGGYPYPGHGGGGGGHGGGGHCWHGCCRRGSYGGCRCCASADEVPEPMYRPEADVHN